ncbi:uncharacterized protein LOC120843295 [Ixodes scapularis]|uniref:uncharacterized protein LOC120843295 n=1 Tax=Ixodes scapularis TaxID=6945 RepID=UPI001C388D2E|nr:uncharacterized protein LOC120843295 [Ixodes scapularis]
MGLHYAVLFACVIATMVWPTVEDWAPSFHWTKNMTIRNPDNRPTFNYPGLEPLQDAWKVLEETSKDTYFLMFRSGDYAHEKCLNARANITDKTNKTATYKIGLYNPEKEIYENTTIQVRALSQTDYPLENVIRANLKGTLPSATPDPPGSYTYVQHDNATCYSRGTPFPDRGVAAEPQSSTEEDDLTESILDNFFRSQENPQYIDMYVVYSEPQCYILRSPAALGGCDLWLRKTELKSIVDSLKEDIIKKEKEVMEYWKVKFGIDENSTLTRNRKQFLESTVGSFIERWFQDVVLKRISPNCVLAFMITCGSPLFQVYNPVTCNTTLTEQYDSIS